MVVLAAVEQANQLLDVLVGYVNCVAVLDRVIRPAYLPCCHTMGDQSAALPPTMNITEGLSPFFDHSAQGHQVLG